MEPDIYKLIRLANEGEKQALNKIIESNMGLIWSVVRKFSGRGVESEDLFQIGCIGLIKAVKKFDESFGVQFSTYAVPMIMGEIKRYLRDDGIVKVSRGLKELSIKARAAKEQLSKGLQREPVMSEIAQHLGVDTAELVMAMDACTLPDSLNAAYDDDSRNLIDKLDGSVNVESDTIDKVLVQQLLSGFQARERQVIMLRYYGNKSQTQIASMLGISQVQVSRIEKRVLEQMRKTINS